MKLYTTGSPAADLWLGLMVVLVFVVWLVVADLAWAVFRPKGRK